MTLNPLLTRRDFVITTLAAGFALAVQPVSAATITTDSNGLEAGEVQIPTSDGHIPAYRAQPEGGKSLATVLVIQEIFGVHEHIKDVCRRFAKLGYLAIAPALYARQGDTTKMTDFAEIQKIVATVPDPQVLSDLDATVDWAMKSGAGDPARLGITGFCWGGRIAWLYAAHNPHVVAAGAWYGRLVGQTDALHPQNPIDIASTLKTPVLGLYGGADQGIPVDTIEQMRAKLKAAGNPSEIVVYPDTPHAFFADYRPSYHEAEAKDGWKRLQEWFTTHGLAPDTAQATK